jgi:hypothetical protein
MPVMLPLFVVLSNLLSGTDILMEPALVNDTDPATILPDGLTVSILLGDILGRRILSVCIFAVIVPVDDIPIELNVMLGALTTTAFASTLMLVLLFDNTDDPPFVKTNF